MLSSGRDWRDIALAAASAVFLPVVLFLIPLNDVVSTNSQELRYAPMLMRWFFYAGLLTWIVGLWVVTRFRGRAPARLWIGLPWVVLLLDVAGAALERRGVSIPLSGAVDALVVTLVATLAVIAQWSRLRAVAAIVGVALLAQGVWAHESFIRKLSRDEVLGANTVPAAISDPGPDAPGNVYHILLDDYLSESFSYSTRADAAQRYPGFTFFSRFNTNFPHTSSSEPALIEGRLPTPGMSIMEWPLRALRSGFWKDLAAANIGVWVYPYGRFMCPDYAVKCLASSDVERDSQIDVTRRTTVDLWALRLFPASVRRWLNARFAPYHGFAPEATAGFSATGAIQSAFTRAGTRGRTSSHAISSVPTQYFNLKLFDEMLADEAQRPARGQYVYYHALIPHPPYILNEQCEYVGESRWGPSEYWAYVRCANLMIERLVHELARLGRLDDALIIVHADHGDMEFLLDSKLKGRGIDFALDPGARRYQRPDSIYAGNFRRLAQVNDGDNSTWRSMAVEVFSSGLLLAKFPHATAYSEDRRPVQLLDIAPTVLAHFGVTADRSYDGIRIEEVSKGRSSVFFAHNRTFKGGFSKYELRDSGWKFVSRVPVSR